MRTFLPPGESYGIGEPKADEFAQEGAELLGRIGNGMNVRNARTQGRIPSPVSGAYIFYTNLFLRSLAQEGEEGETEDLIGSSGRQDLQRDARQTFRGLVSVFALRDVLDLDIGFKSIRLSPNAGPIHEVLVPALRATPGGQKMWNPIQFYTLRTNGEEEVLAGRSPLTGIFPSATPPSRLTCLYWYDAKDNVGRGKWYDPTGNELDEHDHLYISPATREKVCGLMRLWLDRVLQQTDMSTLQRSMGGVTARGDAQRLIKELEAWRAELADSRIPENVDVSDRPLAQGAGTEDPPFLRFAVQASPEHVLTDLPIHRGRLIVTHELLRKETTRLYGRQFGQSGFDDVIDRLPESGRNLGQALGLGENTIPREFVFIDRLFTPYLTLITVDGFSREWKGLTVENSTQTEYYLIPLDPEILEIMDQDDLLETLSARLAEDGQNYIVQLDFGETTVTKLYSTTGRGEYQLDPDIGREEFDLRLFPNFDLSSVQQLLDGDGKHPDDNYYARLRLSPLWDFDRAEPFAVNAQRLEMNIHSELFHLGDETPRSGQEISPGRAAFYTIPKKPDGFHIPERGFCLLDLRDPRPEGVAPAEWSIGIDFGTSNTCVAYQEASDQNPKVLRLPVLTTTLLERPNYNARFDHVFEGASAALDFFYKFGRKEQKMMSQLYFPTQLLTQQNNIESDDEFDLTNGLIYFDNISLDDPSLLSLIKGYPQGQSEVPQRFSVKQDIKWQKTDWLRVFMHHLRKQVVLTAARQNARIASLHFSYPKSFGLTKRKRFETDLTKVWENNGNLTPQMSSESEAARDYVVEGNNQHVIFDIGGGTTDIIAFENQEPVFQTSFHLAAGQINDYIVKAPQFRKQFIDAVKNTAKDEVIKGKIADMLLEKFIMDPKEPRDEHTVLQLWLGLLQQITDADRSNSGKLLARILNYLRTEAKAGGPIQGFFLTNALLLCGLAYYAGQLLKAASEGKFEERRTFSMSRVSITLTGNGSRLYNTLNIDEHPFSEVMKRLFHLGLEREENDDLVRFEGLFKYRDEIAPKVTVALGLLRESRRSKLRDVPVANVVGEEGYPYDTHEGKTVFDSSLVSFYQAVENRDVLLEPPQEAPPNLSRFLNGLGEVLPYGRHGEFEVIPQSKKGWAGTLLSDLYRKAVPHIKDRGYENAKLAKGIEGEPEDKRPALEPLFIAEVVGLIEAIREQYAA